MAEYTGTYRADQISSYDVYESPDGGITIYKRKSGSTERTLHHVDMDRVSPELKARIELERRRNQWADIFNTAERTPALQEAIERVIVLYELTKDSTTLPPDWHPV
jgi:predicted translin family RNA/ssDNA-binding protein